MRILSWNINGIRSLPQYHPWYTLKTCEAMLEELKADVICFQEMKIPKTALERPVALPGHFDAVFSFPASNRGYSGVAIYTDSRKVVAKKGEEGLVGRLQPKPPLTMDEQISPSYPSPLDFEFFPDEEGSTPLDFVEMDSEGRVVMLDFGLFVLINVYCPAETSEDRLPFKMNFHLLLEERVRKLVEEEKREVIVAGDINVAAQPLDHAEGSLASRQAGFWDHPARAWYHKWLAPNGPMVDAIRLHWPDRQGMFTCWNNIINGREANYGSRIDYILITKGLLPWLKFGDIQADIRGSDHCPIFIDLHDEIVGPNGDTLRLQEAMGLKISSNGGIVPQEPPRISAKFWEAFSGKQLLLSRFFTKKSETPPLSASQETKTANSDEAPTTTPISHPITESYKPSGPGSPTPHLPEPELPKALGKRKQSSEMPSQESSSSQPSTSKLKTKKSKNGQPTLASFFTAPPSKPSKHSSSSKLKSRGTKRSGASQGSTTSSRSRSPVPPEVIEVDSDSEDPTSSFASPNTTMEDQLQADYLLAVSLSDQGNGILSPSHPPGSPKKDKKAWANIMAPLNAPLCTVHREAAKQFTVNKPGPNKGKTFFMCSRPVGPGYDKGTKERLREEVDPRYRCNFFMWASDARRSAREQNLSQSTRLE